MTAPSEDVDDQAAQIEAWENREITLKLGQFRRVAVYEDGQKLFDAFTDSVEISVDGETLVAHLAEDK